MKSLVLVVFLFVTVSCLEDSTIIECYAAPCNVSATVVDFSGTDGCGLLLELPNGRRLIPIRLVYVQAPTPEQDPIYHYPLTAGEDVYINFNESEGATTCMAGDLVFITCIRSAAAE